MRKREPAVPFTLADQSAIKAAVYAVRSGADASDPIVAKALKIARRLPEPFASIVARGGALRSMTTSLVIEMNRVSPHSAESVRAAAWEKWRTAS